MLVFVCLWVLVLVCLPEVRHQPIYNLVILVFFTACEGLLLGIMSTHRTVLSNGAEVDNDGIKYQAMPAKANSNFLFFSNAGQFTKDQIDVSCFTKWISAGLLIYRANSDFTKDLNAAFSSKESRTACLQSLLAAGINYSYSKQSSSSKWHFFR